ncbi:flagellar biosynthesis anti-sigma factor FlgM [Sulfurimonas sp.]|uniref:flagellar biosynthesis anti-sigma factor FlgM n=1 Tax=Sulfurimonas sp. TaxID=2022749 RepID=UPI00262C0F71|nr:flagellar biosynthesis anti-sigma factor FlgM [Sulfurimonas sp.]
MITQLNNSSLASTLANDTVKNTHTKQSAGTKQNSASRVEQLKESINSGEYKVDLSALANKMADELL